MLQVFSQQLNKAYRMCFNKVLATECSSLLIVCEMVWTMRSHVLTYENLKVAT